MGQFPYKSAGRRMSTRIPTAHPGESVGEVLQKLAGMEWDDIHMVYVLSAGSRLVGDIPVASLLSAKKTDSIGVLMQKPKTTVHPFTPQEKMVIDAVTHDLKSIPVVSSDGRFLGAIEAESIIDVLHEEHLEDFLRSSGILGSGSQILNLAQEKILAITRYRLPWLAVGLGIGFILSITTSRFETAFRENIALVFFIPIITYISDAVGTQSETIFIRAITLMKIQYPRYILKEGIIGLLMGIILGSVAGIFASILSGSAQIGLVVGLSLLISMTLASVLACIIPLILKTFSKDPAIGSGPFTTAIQDFTSIAIYLIIAQILLAR